MDNADYNRINHILSDIAQDTDIVLVHWREHVLQGQSPSGTTVPSTFQVQRYIGRVMLDLGRLKEIIDRQ